MLDVGDLVAHQEEVAVAVDGGQEVVEVVGDAAGELADRLHLLGLDELGLEGLELGGVGEDGEERGRAVEHGAGEGDLQEDLLAVGGAAGDLGAAEGAALGGVGEALGDRAAEALDQLGEVGAGAGAVAEELAGGLVGVGEPARGLESGEGDREFLEEVVGDEAGYFGAVEGHEQDVAIAVVVGDDHRADRLSGACQHVNAVGAERRVGEDAGNLGRAVGEGRRGGIGVEDATLGVEAQPGDVGMGEAGGGLGRGGAALEAPEQRPRAHAGDGDAATVGGVLGGDAVEPGLAGQAIADGLGGVEPPAGAGGGVGAEDAAVEVAEDHRLGVALEVADLGGAFAGSGAEPAGTERQEVATEDHERHGDGAGDHHRPGPERRCRRA